MRLGGGLRQGVGRGGGKRRRFLGLHGRKGGRAALRRAASGPTDGGGAAARAAMRAGRGFGLRRRPWRRRRTPPGTTAACSGGSRKLAVKGAGLAGLDRAAGGVDDLAGQLVAGLVEQADAERRGARALGLHVALDARTPSAPPGRPAGPARPAPPRWPGPSGSPACARRRRRRRSPGTAAPRRRGSITATSASTQKPGAQHRPDRADGGRLAGLALLRRLFAQLGRDVGARGCGA